MQDEEERGGAAELPAALVLRRRCEGDARPAHQRGQGGENERRADHGTAPAGEWRRQTGRRRRLSRRQRLLASFDAGFAGPFEAKMGLS